MRIAAEARERLRERIRKNVVVHPMTGCWLWQRRINNSGYGVMSVRLEGYVEPVKLFAHRVAYAVFKRVPPRDRHVAHSIRCVSQACCNPEHLRATTQSSNERDKKRAERWRRRHLREMFPPTHLVDQQEPLRKAA